MWCTVIYCIRFPRPNKKLTVPNPSHLQPSLRYTNNLQILQRERTVESTTRNYFDCLRSYGSSRPVHPSLSLQSGSMHHSSVSQLLRLPTRSRMRFIKPSARGHRSEKMKSMAYAFQPVGPVRWSDIAADRKSTHPDVAPIKRILDTAELCENVLKHLPPRDLVRLQRLCRATQAVIESSPALKCTILET